MKFEYLLLELFFNYCFVPLDYIKSSKFLLWCTHKRTVKVEYKIAAKSPKFFIVILSHGKSINLNAYIILFWPINLPICVATILRGIPAFSTQFIPLNWFHIYIFNYITRTIATPSSAWILTYSQLSSMANSTCINLPSVSPVWLTHKSGLSVLKNF